LVSAIFLQCRLESGLSGWNTLFAKLFGTVIGPGLFGFFTDFEFVSFTYVAMGVCVYGWVERALCPPENWLSGQFCLWVLPIARQVTPGIIVLLVWQSPLQHKQSRI